ncbi:mobile mystery protein B [Alcaligenes aquatilis]|uniref:Mobile mystery protein B n=1 Tax=Alcaligenes aquatilis TaxID=323284 RepID=A0A3G2HSJ3_9BURK|nr:mobile mystery protein B [Alcaligenes aquatilis]AYN20102.1 mobile mystery protein B [Alcaligenes aquatilis]
MAIDFTPQSGQTPVDEDEKAGLIPRHISTIAELNEWEAVNIQAALQWLGRQRQLDVLNEVFCRRLHKEMFKDTWRWAGEFRRSDKNIGCDWLQVSTRLRQLMGNTAYWIDAQTYDVDEIAARFHHLLVSIHPFPNGNGRHAREMANALLHQLGHRPFTWGGGRPLGSASNARTQYIEALRAADQGDYAALLAFVRS